MIEQYYSSNILISQIPKRNMEQVWTTSINHLDIMKDKYLSE